MLQVRNIHQTSNKQYQEEIENMVNEFFSKHTGKYENIDFPITTSAYHNNGKKIYPVEVCKSLVNLLKAHGFYCALTKPSWAYSTWMDFSVSSYLRTSSNGNILNL